MEDKVSLYEVLVKTSYLTQITELDDQNCENPCAFGSGFIVESENSKFFVTADHTVHLDDYNGTHAPRAGKDYVVSIFNNYSPPENFLSTVITPLGSFHYLDQFQLNKLEDAPTPIDVTISRMRKKHFQYPFFTDEVNFPTQTIKAGEQKFFIKTECFNEPESDKEYFVFGKIKTKIVGHIRVDWQSIWKPFLRFNSKVGDYFLFNTPEVIEDKEEWEGLSGSPIISQDGECVGVLCSINEKSKSIWVMPISTVRLLIDVALQEELGDAE